MFLAQHTIIKEHLEHEFARFLSRDLDWLGPTYIAPSGGWTHTSNIENVMVTLTMDATHSLVSMDLQTVDPHGDHQFCNRDRGDRISLSDPKLIDTFVGRLSKYIRDRGYP
jgi:hypothetical protein